MSLYLMTFFTKTLQVIFSLFKNRICPNPTITPKRMFRLKNSNHTLMGDYFEG